MQSRKPKEMTDNVQIYITTLKKGVYELISKEINEITIYEVIQNDLVKSHLEAKESDKFQKYYFNMINNEQSYFESTDFFKQFKKNYSLQGIDNDFLNKLEGSKEVILKQIRTDNLAQLYFDIFRKAEIKHGKGFREKDLGSFFAKLVHTFRPNEYCALDNPIKNYFGLKKESFFIAFHVISLEYKHWSSENGNLLETTRKKLKQADKETNLNHEKITDLKLLDLIFWSKANKK